jgi:hypothetical protein
LEIARTKGSSYGLIQESGQVAIQSSVMKIEKMRGKHPLVSMGSAAVQWIVE